MTIDSEKNIVTGKDIYIEDAKKDFLSNVNFIGDTTQKTEDPIQWKEAQGNDLHLTDISLTEVKDFNVLGDSKQEEIEAVEGKSIEGEYITVTDADLSKEFSLEYLGNSKQEQREGYNLFNSEIETQTIKGVEVSYDKVTGYIKLNGTVETDIEGEKYDSTIFNVKNSGKILVQANIDYTLSIEKISGTYSTNSPLDTSSLIQLWDNSSGTWLYPYRLSFYNLKTSSSVNITKSQTTDVIYNQIQLTLRDGDVFNNLIIGIQFNEGELKPFEQYGETPSIKIPSEIENVKAWNLIDVEQIAQQTENVVTTFDKKNGWLTIENPNSNMAYVNILVPIEHIIIGKTYSLKVEFKSEEGCNVYLQKSPEDYSKFTQGIDAIIKNTATDTYMKVLITPIANQTVTVRLSLAEEQEKIENKTYTPYGVISIGLGNSNINDEIYELGGFTNDTGENVNQSDRFRIKNYIDIEKFQSVTIKSNVKSMINAVGRYGLFDKNKIQIENAQITSTNYTINTKNAKYLRFWFLNNPSENFDMNTAKILVSSESSDYVTHQEQNYNLHLGDLELNGVDDIRDSFVVEVDNSYSYKKVKKLYLKKKFEKFNILSSFPLSLVDNDTKISFSSNGVSSFNPKISLPESASSVVNGYCNYLKIKPQFELSSSSGFAISQWTNVKYGYFSIIDFPTVENLQQFLDEHNVYVTYEIEPQLINLTDDYPELVQDIETIMNNMELYEETTHLYTSGNLVIKLDYNYITPSPSINRPSEIENLTGDVDIINTNKNLYNYKDTSNVSSGVTVDEEGWITITADNTEGSTILYQNYATNNLNLKTNTNYNIIAEIKSVTGNGTLALFSKYGNGGQFSINDNTSFASLANNSVIQRIATTKESFENVTNELRSYVYFNAGQSGSITFRISVLEDTTITADTFSYVPFLNQTYTLHLDDLELNGLGDIRDSFVVELDNSYSNKKIKNLYLNKKLYKHIFTGEETLVYYNAPNEEKAISSDTAYFTITPNLSGNNVATKKSNVLCNIFVNKFNANELWGTYWTTIFSVESISLQGTIRLRIFKNRFPSWDNNLTDTEKQNLFKNYITDLYNQGNPMYAIYELNEPQLIDLTEDYPQLVEDIENILNNIELYEDVTNIYIDGLGEIYIKYDGYDGTPALKNPSEVFNITGEQTVTITNTNKFNLLNYQLPGTIYEKNGITFIMNNDGTIDLYGYADEDAEWYLVGGVDKNYDTIMSFDSEYTLQLYENKDSNVFIYLMNDSKVIAMTNLKDNFSYNGDIDTIMIRVNKGTTVDTTIYPILTEETEQEAEEREEDYTKANQQLYKIRLKDLELNGDNNVRDTFEIEFTQDDTGFKNITKLYHNKNFSKYIFTGEEKVTLQRIQNGIARFDMANIFNNKVNSMLGIYCNYLKNDVTEVENTIRSGQDDFISTCVIYIDQNIANTAESLKAYLKRLYDEGNPMYVIYQLANTEKVLIQDEDLIQDLENLLNAITYEGVNKIKSTATVVIEYTVKYKDNYDFYIDENDKFFCVPQYGIKFLFSPMESNIPEIAEATESTVKIRNKDGDLVLSTTYEPISLDIVCYTDENLDAKQKIAEISKVTRFLDSIKYKTKKIALLSSERMFPVKYNKNLTPTRYPKSIRFSIPLKSSKSYSNVLYPTKIFGNGEEYSNTIRETGCIITIYGPAQTPIIYLNGYEMKYDNVILDGNKLIIDTGNSTVTHVTSKDVRTNAAIYYNHEYPKIQNGINKIEIKSGIGYDKQVITEWYDLKL